MGSNGYRTMGRCVKEYEVSSNTQDCPQPQTITSLPHLDGKRLGSAPRRRWPSSRPELVGARFGSVTVISPEIKRRGRGRKAFVLVRCVTCGRESWISYSNVSRGRSAGCRSCNQPLQVPKWLIARLAQARQRCENASDGAYKYYGARGIRFGFNSVLAAALWVQENLGLMKHMQLDRIENNGHYEAGNLRWATRRQNMLNTRKKKVTAHAHAFKMLHPEVRYSDSTLCSMISRGLSRKEIVKRWEAPSRKPKGVYGTYSTPDPEIASQSRGFLSTTA